MWTVDPSTLVSLRLVEAERALSAGDLDRALIEAEELLDENPAHAVGLSIVSNAALAMGDVLTALAALNRLVELHPPSPSTLQSLAAARFEAVDYPGSLAAAEQAAGLDPTVAAAWHYQGLALERMGRPEEAHTRFARAHKLESSSFPLPASWDDIDWQALLEGAQARLPKTLEPFYNELPVRWGDFPAVEDLLENYPPLSPFTDALYRGNRAPDADPWTHRPQYITLFQGNLCRPSTEAEAITERIKEALIHEAFHWLGVADLPIK